jgi:hypothetical protein
MPQTNEDADDEVETEQQLSGWHRVEIWPTTKVPHLWRLSKSQMLFIWSGISFKCVVNFSIVQANTQFVFQLISIKTDDMRQQAYINVSGAAMNFNKTDSFFEVNAAQYTSYYKNNRTLSILPVQAQFNSNKFKTKKPIPSNNTYVSIEGFLENIETDTAERATLFSVSVDNINFLSRATLSASTASSTGEHV